MILGIDASQANRKNRTGTEWYAFHLIEEFKKLIGGRSDITVKLYVRDLPQVDLVNNLPSNFEFKILRWPLPYFWGQGRLSLEMLFHPPDILFCPAHTIPLIHPKKIYTTLHDVGFEDNPELYDQLSLWYHRWSAKFAVKRATHIFTISEFSKKRILEIYKCPPGKLTVTHLGVDLRFSAADPRVLEKHGLKTGSYIFFLGRLEPKKNILGMVKAFEVANLPVSLVLGGSKVRTKDVEEYLRDRPALRNKIRFLNNIEKDDMPALYHGARLFLFPTFYEGFGLPILEAQASGTPVITSNETSSPEIAGDGAILVNPRSVEQIAGAIKKLLSDESLRSELVQNGLANVKRFSWEECARMTLDKMIKVI